jgi:hypothetical protein
MVVLLWNVVSSPSYSVKKKKKIGGTLEDLRFFFFKNSVVEGSDILLWFRLFRCYAGGVLVFFFQWAYDCYGGHIVMGVFFYTQGRFFFFLCSRVFFYSQGV